MAIIYVIVKICISSHIFITDGIQCLTENTLIIGIYLLTAFLTDSIIIVFLA